MIMDFCSQITMLKVEEQLFFDQGIISIIPALLSFKDSLNLTIFDIKSTLPSQSNWTESVSQIMQDKMMIALGLILFKMQQLMLSQMQFQLRFLIQRQDFYLELQIQLDFMKVLIIDLIQDISPQLQ